ncbi:MAG TPA: LysR substrate-binding domain-containing protein [Bordetella sp.]
MRTRLTVQELEKFIDVAETLSFRASAARCSVSQPALSRTIASAEAKLGTRLFDRNTHEVTLTQSGRQLLPIARRIVYELHDSLSDLAEFVAGRSGRISIASIPSVAASVLPDSMQRFLQAYPNVSIGLRSVSAEEVLSNVADGSADIGVSALTFDQATLEASRFAFTPFRKDDLLLICAEDDPLASRKSVTWEVFTQRPYIANGATSSIRLLAERVFANTPGQLQPRYESFNISVTARMVAAGLGIAVMPSLAKDIVNTQGLAFLKLTDPVVSRNIGIFTLKNRSLAVPTQNFLRYLHGDASALSQ